MVEVTTVPQATDLNDAESESQFMFYLSVILI